MKSRWESKILLFTVNLATLWFVVGLLLRLFSRDLVEDIAVGFYLAGLPNYPTLFMAIFLVLLLSGMLRRQRIALLFYLIFFQLYYAAASTLLLAYYLLDYSEFMTTDFLVWVILPLVTSVFYLFLGVRALPDFPAKVNGNWKRALAILVLGLAASLALVMAILYFGFHHSVREILHWTAYVLLGLSPVDVVLEPGIHVAKWVRIVGEVAAAISVLGAFVVLLRSVNAPQSSVQEHMATRRILLSPPSEDSLGYFATNDDRSLVLTENGKAGISYRVIDGVCIAAGNPLGDPQHWPEAIRAFKRVAHTNGWIVAAASISEPGARAYADAGLRIMPMGDEAVIDTKRFDIKELHAVRKVVNAAKRKGYTVRIQPQSALSAEDRARLKTNADQWRNGDERGFTMASGRVADERDWRTVVVTAHDAEGKMQALLTLVPWGRRGLSLDVMRRSPEAPSGLTELMVSELAKEGQGINVDKFSLNFVVLREVMERGQSVTASPFQRLVLKFLVFSSRWWQIQTLYQSNLKYNPDWQPRFLAVDSAFHTARMLIAFASGEGFLPRYQPPLQPHGDPAEIHALEEELLASKKWAPKLSQQQRWRREKLAELREYGEAGYPASVPRTHSLAQLGDVKDGEQTISVTGRVHRLRDHGGVQFADIEEGGVRFQIVVERSAGEAACTFRRFVSKGDVISVTGRLGASRTGTPSVLLETWRMASKSLVDFPTQTLTDPHTRAKLRHMDLGTNNQARDLVIARAKVVDAIRQTLRGEDFLEAETPILQTVHGGANARPFRTHIRAYDQHLTLRIAPELYLKRLIVGGIPKVFELGRNFRNEGVDATHNPEFTALEVYEAYGDWNTMRVLTERIIRNAAIAVHGKTTITVHQDEAVELDLSKPWAVVPVYQAVSEAVGKTIRPEDSLEDHQDVMDRFGLGVNSVGELVNELYDELVEPNTVEPTFYSWFPVETSPLTMADPEQPLTAQRWDLVACGMELGTAYTELADPLEQRERLTEQSLKAAGGDPEAMEVDENFLTALEFGMPPTGGLGIGVDRLVMFLLEQNIREVLAFPFVKPE